MHTLNEACFWKFSELIYARFGIKLSPDKRLRLESKLSVLLKSLGLSSFDDLYHLATRDGECLAKLADAVTINKTDFFRESHHFSYLVNQWQEIVSANDSLRRRREVRIWSAGCSTGEEAYTLALVLAAGLGPDWLVRILGTDISHRALTIAQLGRYDRQACADIPTSYHHYLEFDADGFRIGSEIRRLVTFRHFNLMSQFPFQGKFDLVFCRNVMIYFDQAVQERLINRFYDVLAPGGLLFIGHSETLNNRKNSFRFLRPTIYQRSAR